jgi:hypothetical protein
MTDAGQEFLRLLTLKDSRFGAIPDEALEGVLIRGKAALVQILRAAMDEIGRLPDAGPGCEARRNAEIAWLSAVLASLQPLQ